MSDVIDDAAEVIERTLEANIKAAREAIIDPMSNDTGECLWCGSEVSDGRRFCDKYCADDWEKMRKYAK